LLQRDQSTLVSFIPDEFAAVGAVLRLKRDCAWEDGWLVREVYDAERVAPDVGAQIAWSGPDEPWEYTYLPAAGIKASDALPATRPATLG